QTVSEPAKAAPSVPAGTTANPSIKPQISSAPKAPPPDYDGVWVVRPSPGCLASAPSIARVSHGQISGPAYSGTISPDGTVRGIGHIGFIEVRSSGHSSATEGFGTFRQSTGCSGTWTSHKL